MIKAFLKCPLIFFPLTSHLHKMLSLACFRYRHIFTKTKKVTIRITFALIN